MDTQPAPASYRAKIQREPDGHWSVLFVTPSARVEDFGHPSQDAAMAAVRRLALDLAQRAAEVVR